MGELFIHVGVAFYWSFAVVVYLGMRLDRDYAYDLAKVIGTSVFWPLFAVFGVVVVLWRIPFKTVRQMRQEIRAKGQWKDYLEWVEARKDTTDDQ